MDNTRLRNALNTIIGNKNREDTQDCLRIYKAKISTAYNAQTKKCGVKLNGDDIEISAQCTSFMAHKAVGDVVWVAMPFSNLRNAVVWGDSGFQVGGLPEIAQQTLTVWDLKAGVYLWTYAGTKKLRQNSSTTAVSLPSELTAPVVVTIQELYGGHYKTFSLDWQYPENVFNSIVGEFSRSYTSSFKKYVNMTNDFFYIVDGESYTLISYTCKGDVELLGYIDTTLPDLTVNINGGTTTIASMSVSSTYKYNTPICVKLSFSGEIVMTTIVIGSEVQTTAYYYNSPEEISFVVTSSFEDSYTFLGTTKSKTFRSLT